MHHSYGSASGWVFLYTEDGNSAGRSLNIILFLPVYTIQANVSSHSHERTTYMILKEEENAGAITTYRFYCYLVQTQLKPRVIAGGLLAGYEAYKHCVIYDQQAKRPKQAASWISAGANNCRRLNQWTLVWWNSIVLSRWSHCQVQVRSLIQSYHPHHYLSLCPK